MKKPLLLGLALAVALVGLALGLPLLRERLGAAPAASATADEAPGVASTPTPLAPVPTVPLAKPEPTPSSRPLKSLGRASLDAQVRQVVESMDLTGRPPAGVAQGGARKGKERGAFQNLEHRLPAKAPGYYREADVWPWGAASRGPERLVFGREGEVYYSKDHYRTFVRLR